MNSLKWCKKFIGKINSEGNLVDLEGLSLNHTRPILIVSRNHYRERTRDYPIESLRDLKKTLALRIKSEDEEWLTQVGKNQTGGAWVKDYIFKKSTLDAYSKSLICIPETLLLAESVENQSVTEFKNKGRSVFIYRNKDMHKSIIKAGTITDLQRFCAVNAVPQLIADHANVLSFDDNDLLNMPFYRVYRHIGWCHFAGIRERLKKSAAKTFILAGVLLTCYVLISSAYVMYLDKKLDTSIKNSSVTLQASIEVNDRLSALKKRSNVSNRVTETFSSSSIFWLTLHPLIELGARINLVEFNDGKFSVNGEYSSASFMLEVLQESPSVASASFKSPIVKRGDKEVFSIEVKLLKRSFSKEEDLES